MEKTNKKTWRIYRILSVITVIGMLTFASLTAFADTYTTSYDSDTIDLQVNNETFQEINVSCPPGGTTTLTMTVGNDTTTNLRAEDGYRNGYGECTVTFTHNDPNSQAGIYYEKDYNENIQNSTLTDSISDVGSDCYIDGSGNDDTNEEIGYYLRNVIIDSNFSVATDGDTQCNGKDFDESTCGGGSSSACHHDIEYTSNADKIIEKSSTTAGTCFVDDCTFLIQVMANITFGTEPGSYHYTSSTSTFPTTLTISSTP